MKERITIHIATKDRHSELALLLQSLRTQTIQFFDVLILDDASGTPVTQCGFLMALIQRLLLENHRVKILRNEQSNGVCAARNKLIDNDTFDNKYIARLDDDCILEPDYLDRMIEVIGRGYDLATGVVPLLAHPSIRKNTTFDNDNTMCLHKLDKEGKLIERRDELAYTYKHKLVLPCHQFRTNCFYKKEVTDSGVRYPERLSFVGFREELYFSFRSIIKGFKIGVDLGAIAYHLQTMSGGTRSWDYAESVRLDEETTNRWIKRMYEKHGDFLNGKKY